MDYLRIIVYRSHPFLSAFNVFSCSEQCLLCLVQALLFANIVGEQWECGSKVSSPVC